MAYKEQLSGIQYLRGIAATSVVLFHLSLQLSRISPNLQPFNTLQYGVDLFFVISGFVMAYSTDGGLTLSAAEFFKRRFSRIVPLYWIATTVAAVVLAVGPQYVRATVFSWSRIISSFLFLPFDYLNAVHSSPIVAIGWTLNYEMFFYSLFAISIATSYKRPYRTVVTTSLLILVLVAFGCLFAPTNAITRFYTNPILIEFVFGMAIGSVTLNISQALLPEVITFIALIAMFALPDQGERARSIVYGPLASLIVASAANVCWPKNRLLLLIGNASYSIYISHFFVVSAYAQTWSRVLGDPSSWVAEGNLLSTRLRFGHSVRHWMLDFS